MTIEGQRAKLRYVTEAQRVFLGMPRTTCQFRELWDRDELYPHAPKADELKLCNFGVWHVDLEHRAPNQSAESYGQVFELIAGADEASQVGVPEFEAFEGQASEPPEGGGEGSGECHELHRQFGAPGAIQTRRRECHKLEELCLTTAHGLLDDAADGTQVRG